MGFLTDFLANPKSFSYPALDAKSRVIVHQIEALIARGLDGSYPSATAFSETVQHIAEFSGTVSGGTFKLNLTLNGVSVGTGNALAYTANAAALQTEIDTVGAAHIPGYVAGDIVVAGGPLGSAAVTLTYSGASLANQVIGLATANSAGLTGGGSVGAITATTVGQPNRPAWAILYAFGMITAGIPTFGSAPSALTVGVTPGSLPMVLHQDAITAICTEAMFGDNNMSVQADLLAALGFPLGTDKT